MMKQLAVALLVVASACGSTSSSGQAEAQVEALLRAIDRGDCDKVKSLVIAPKAIECGLVEQAEGTFSRSGIDIDDVDFSSSEAVDDSVVVTVDWGQGLPGEPFDVQRVDGQWLVVFDSDA